MSVYRISISKKVKTGIKCMDEWSEQFEMYVSNAHCDGNWNI